MPQMGYDMQEGTLVRWLKSEGAEVQVGEPIAEIETDKAVVEFESYASGILTKILVAEGTTVPVGQVIAVVGEESEMIEDTAPMAPPPPMEVEAPYEQPTPIIETRQSEVTYTNGREMFASPVARRLADERDIDLANVHGTGPGGRISKDDVLAYQPTETPVEEPHSEETGHEEAAIPMPAAIISEFVAEPIETPAPATEEPPPPDEPPDSAVEPEQQIVDELDELDVEPSDAAPTSRVIEVEEPHAEESEEPEEPADVEVEVEDEAESPEPVVAEAEEILVPLSRMRQQIARVTVKSKQEKPHFYVSSEIDMSQAMELRQHINRTLEHEGIRVTVNDLIIKACVEALKRFPKFNAYFEEDGIRMNDTVNIGVAIAEDEGLIVPAMMNCENKSLKEIAVASKDLADRSKSGTLTSQEYNGGTFAISNLGMFDISSFIAIIQPPQSAVLAVGTVSKKPVVKDDEIGIAQMMTATLSADHRIVDGAEGAQFLIAVKELLQSPLSMLV